MGLTATDDGISIQFFHKDGRPEGPPSYGRYAAVYGKPQTQVIGGGYAATPDETNFKGSADWLTLLAVADTKEKLDLILAETTVPKTAANTSGSSRRVQIETDIGGMRRSYKNRITIGSGPIVDINGPKVDVVHVKVLPEGTQMGDLGADNQLVSEFQGNAITLQTK